MGSIINASADQHLPDESDVENEPDSNSDSEPDSEPDSDSDSIAPSQIDSNNDSNSDHENDPDSDSDSTARSQIDPEEEIWTSAISTERRLADDDLSGLNVSAQKITRMIESVLPSLSASTSSQRMAIFYTAMRSHLQQSPPRTIPIRLRTPSTWPAVSPGVNNIWEQALAAEKVLVLDLPLHEWLDMEDSNLCKYCGSLEDTILLYSSDPTAKNGSSVHLEFRTVDDLSNISMLGIYAELGFYVANIRKHGLLHIDMVPRRLNRDIIPSTGTAAQDIFRKLPLELSVLWQHTASKVISRS
jgi:hypothetical protein